MNTSVEYGECGSDKKYNIVNIVISIFHEIVTQKKRLTSPDTYLELEIRITDIISQMGVLID